MSDDLLHRRSIEVNCYDDGEFIRSVARLRDERPWNDRVPVLHDMELSLRVSLADMVITDADATMHTFPHEECPFIAPKFRQLEGLSITRGFTRALRELFAGVSGCAHLHELARVSGPAVFQATAAHRARHAGSGTVDADEGQLRRIAKNMNGTCHVWATGGYGEQKLELGWRPGLTVYPAPAVETLRQQP